MSRYRQAVIVGFDYYARYLAQLVNEESQTWRMRAFDSSRWGTIRALVALRGADVLISFGGPGPNVALAEAARLQNIPVFVIWAGSDTQKAASDPWELEVVKCRGYTHLSDGEWLVDELRGLGIEAEYLPVTAIRPGEQPPPLSREFRVLSYLPEPRREFYGEHRVYEIAAAMPGVPFQIFGAGGRNPAAPRNAEFCGYVGDMARRIDDATVLLRLPEHDGKSMLVLEVLARARHVVWNYDFPSVNCARTASAALDVLRRLREEHACKRLATNDAGRAFVLENFSRPLIAKRFVAKLDAVLAERPMHKAQTKRHVAVSGLRMFCADVAQQVERYSDEWSPTILTTNSRLEVLTSLVSLARSDVWYSIGAPLDDRWLHLFARLLRKPRVIHWVGSDVDVLRLQPGFRAYLQHAPVRHLAEVDWMIAELRSHDLDAEIVPLPPRVPASGPVPPLPSQFSVLLYVPKTRSAFYGQPHYERLIAQTRDLPIRFSIVGGGEVHAPPEADVRNLGWQHDLRDAYAQATVLLRFTRHDGLSLMVLEALAYGRHVLWSQRFAFTHAVHEYDEIESELRALYALHAQGLLEPQYDAADMVRSRYTPARCVAQLTTVWSQAVERRSAPVVAEAR